MKETFIISLEKKFYSYIPSWYVQFFGFSCGGIYPNKNTETLR